MTIPKGKWARRLILALALSTAWPVHADGTPLLSSTTARQAIAAATGKVLQGDMPTSLDILGRVRASQLAEKDAAFRSCMLSRFHPAADGSLPDDLPLFAARAVGIYRAYWRASLLRPNDRDVAAERLRINLARLLGSPADTEMGNLETELSQRLQGMGLYSLTGRTPPLRELMLWRQQNKELKDVQLPEGPYKVAMILLDGFASLGWSNFGTCGKSVSGGWARPDGIYAVRPGWQDLTGERFLVSFLGHEAQHFRDKERFESLEAWELEYRAKLAELAMADSSLPALLNAFSNNLGDDPALPHSYANQRVLGALRNRLGVATSSLLESAAPDALKQAAKAELLDDTRRRQR